MARCCCGCNLYEVYDNPDTDALLAGDERVCPNCYEAWAEECAESEAQAYAIEHCRLTAQVPDYDPELHYACSAEDYEMGAKESYTPNALLAWARHNATNYDELVKDLDRDSGEHRAYYTAIRQRVEQLILDAAPSLSMALED